jgi:hypothetical protein
MVLLLGDAPAAPASRLHRDRTDRDRRVMTGFADDLMDAFMGASQPDDDRLSAAGTKAGDLQRAVLALLREHQADGALPTSGRFIWYELEQRGVVDKTQARGHPGVRRGIDQDVSDAMTHLREQGIIPWDWIVDETRTLEVPRYAATVLDWHREAAEDEAESIDRWDGGPPPLILCESRSLAGVLRPVAYRYTAPAAATNGQCGGFLHTEVGPLLRDGGAGRHVLYLGDLDLAGDQIESNTRRVLYRYTRSLMWERLALTNAQADSYDLRRLAVVKRDRRYADGRPHEAIETEALSQTVLTGILTARLDELIPEPLTDVLEREDAQRQEVRALLDGGEQ